MFCDDVLGYDGISKLSSTGSSLSEHYEVQCRESDRLFEWFRGTFDQEQAFVGQMAQNEDEKVRSGEESSCSGYG